MTGHDDQAPAAAALATGMPTILSPGLLPKDTWRQTRVLAESRSSIALLIWAIVCEFTGDRSLLTIPADEQVWTVAEPYIRDHAEEAEQTTIAYGPHKRSGEVIMEVLAELALDDDYLRIKNNTQHKAFGDQS